MDSKKILLEEYDELENKLKEYAKVILQKNSYPQDSFPIELWIIGLINRSLSLLFGFKTLIGSSNYIAAIHLVRPHLDNFLRFNAIWLVEEPQEFCKNVFHGGRIDRLKSTNNENLRDSLLKKEAAKEYNWIDKVYDKTSGIIHFSNTFILTSSRINNDIIETQISKFDKYVPEKSRIEAIECMVEITKCIFSRFDEWIEIRDGRKPVSSQWLKK